jgi:hypothetical protein
MPNPKMMQSVEKRIEVGVTTHDEALATLPPPHWWNLEGGSIYYWGNSLTGFLILLPVPFVPYLSLLTVRDDDWLVTIAFDENNVVASIDTKWGEAARVIKERVDAERAKQEAKNPQDRVYDLRVLAQQGSLKAAYELYKLLAEVGETPVEAWRWLCKAANQGYVDAQFEAGYWQRSVVWEWWAKSEVPRTAWMREAGIGPDDRVTYMWYTLAAVNGHSHPPYGRQAVASDVTPEEITKAEQMVRD